jgi:hypothetical protein
LSVWFKAILVVVVVDVVVVVVLLSKKEETNHETGNSGIIYTREFLLVKRVNYKRIRYQLDG